MNLGNPMKIAFLDRHKSLKYNSATQKPGPVAQWERASIALKRSRVRIPPGPLVQEGAPARLEIAEGPWRSWERVSMALRRSWVRIPLGPLTTNSGGQRLAFCTGNG